jgi:hypothetical protein
VDGRQFLLVGLGITGLFLIASAAGLVRLSGFLFYFVLFVTARVVAAALVLVLIGVRSWMAAVGGLMALIAAGSVWVRAAGPGPVPGGRWRASLDSRLAYLSETASTGNWSGLRGARPGPRATQASGQNAGSAGRGLGR